MSVLSVVYEIYRRVREALVLVRTPDLSGKPGEALRIGSSLGTQLLRAILTVYGRHPGLVWSDRPTAAGYLIPPGPAPARRLRRVSSALIDSGDTKAAQR